MSHIYHHTLPSGIGEEQTLRTFLGRSNNLALVRNKLNTMFSGRKIRIESASFGAKFMAVSQ